MGPTGFDRAAIAAYNQFAGRWPAFDHLVIAVANNNLLKGGVLMAVFLGLWGAARDGGPDELRPRLLVALLAACATEVVAVALSHALPFRPRPLAAGPAIFRLPDGVAATAPEWGKVSAFPSDHATLFGGLAVALCWLAWRAGLPLLLYTLAAILAPRLYLGYHYPTDILAGLALGTLGTGAALALHARVGPLHRGVAALYARAARHPLAFAAALFLVTFEIGELFTGSRGVAQALRAFVLTTAVH